MLQIIVTLSAIIWYWPDITRFLVNHFPGAFGDKNHIEGIGNWVGGTKKNVESLNSKATQAKALKWRQWRVAKLWR